MGNFERKFIVDPEGNAEEKQLTEEEKKTLENPKKMKLLAMKENRIFRGDEKGEISLEGDNKPVLEKKDRA
ncbi:MAG: hypothetical protein KGJ13_04790 [Patescibacteria group bacterium]|nr:hypothetical protein [Patescibacteria group bacterium]